MSNCCSLGFRKLYIVKYILCGLEEGVLGLELIAEQFTKGFTGLDVGDNDLMGVAAQE